jgi:hypothetical protein
MARRRREDYSVAERRELWERWRRGVSISEIGRALDRAPGTIHYTIRQHGGIAPPPRCRGRLALSLAEREEISRGDRCWSFGTPDRGLFGPLALDRVARGSSTRQPVWLPGSRG